MKNQIVIDGLIMQWEGEELWLIWNEIDHKQFSKKDVKKIKTFLNKKRSKKDIEKSQPNYL